MLVLLTGCSTLHAVAGGKKKVKAKAPKTNIQVVEAYSQSILPGIPQGQVQTNYTIVVKWLGTQYPETFFWRGENGWLSCRQARAHRISNKKGATPDYRTEEAVGDQVHKGDTLLLTPVRGGRFPIPAEIPESAKNTLYYKIPGSGWLACPVKVITKKPDIAAP